MSDERDRPGWVEGVVLGSIVGLVGVATASLALAQAGAHDGRAAVGLGLLVTVAVALVALRWAGPVRFRLRSSEVLITAVVLVGSVVMFLPGAPYAAGDKDPGVYVAHAFAIAREGDVTIESEVLERVEEVTPFSPGAVFPGLWIDDDDPTAVTPQFYHLLPATMASAIDLVGSKGVWNLNPLLAGLSVLALALAVRRAAGTVPALLTGVLLCTSMMQVWQAKYPTTEILAQVLLSGAILAVVVAFETRWRGAAAIGGLVVGTGFLARPDGVLYVLLSLGALALVFALRWWDERHAWFLGGLAVALPYPLWNAYGIRAEYTLANTVPRLSLLAVAVAGVAVAAAAARRLLRGRSLRADARLERRAGAALLVVAAGILLLAWYRKDLLGIDHTYFGTRRIRSFDEQNLRWLGFFFTVAGLIAVWGGLAVALLRRWSTSLLLTIAPGLALLPLYLWEAKISPRLMWWVRRFVPGPVPAMVVLVAVLIGWAIASRRRPLQLAGGALGVYLVVAWSGQSLPLRAHREMAGSYAMAEEIAAAADGDDGLFLFVWPEHLNDPTRNFPGPVWLIQDQATAMLPIEPTMADVERYADAFTDRSVFVVTQTLPLPEALDEERFELVRTYATELPMWDESVVERPDHDEPILVAVDVWRLER